MDKFFNVFSHLVNIGFPNNCLSCSNSLVRNERYICSSCHFYLPKSDLQLTNNSETAQLLNNNEILTGASYLFDFDKDGKVQQLLYELKYNSNLNLGFFLGELVAIDFLSQLKDTDLIVPVPLHPKKLYQRGYNQSDLLCEGINNILGKEINKSNLVRIKYTETQTKKNKQERIMNMKKAFTIKHPTQFINKHLLLIDDVITTGSTLVECLRELQLVKGTRVKVLCLAKAKY